MNARVTFSVSPWLLFLIIPAFAAVFALFFIGNKKGSRITVNRVVSAILQCLAATCCVFAISGIRLERYEPNTPEELVVLVDNSCTAAGQRENMDGLVREVLLANEGRCRIAVVLFGYGQSVALEMGNHDAESAYGRYLAAASVIPADGATDIASALKLAWDSSPDAHPLISDPARGKVLILSDGLETDGDAIGAMKALTRDGVQIETSFFADSYLADASILDVNCSEKVLFEGKECSLAVTVNSSFAGETVLSYTDRDVSGNERQGNVRMPLQAGTQELTVNLTFENAGFHEVEFRLESEGDWTAENNVFCSYFEVSEKNRILVIETYKNESALLQSAIAEGTEGIVEVEAKLITEAGEMTEAELSDYGEVILYNSAQKDMPQEFQNALCKYVNELGGGLFTVGGFEKDGEGNILMEPRYRVPDEEVPVKHSYLEEDLKDSVFASMLPVTIEDYKPSVAVVFIFDISASMMTTGGPIHAAVADTGYVMDNVLEAGDYAGIVTLQESYAQTDPLSPMTKKEALKASIAEFEDYYNFDAPTCYAPALQQAADMLSLAPDNVARKHIVLLSDGGPGDKIDSYGKVMEEAGKRGITITVVAYYKRTREIDGELYYFNHDYDVKGYEINVGNMKQLAAYGNGSLSLIPRNSVNGWVEDMKKDMRLDELVDIGYDSFVPKIGENAYELLGGITNLDLKELTLGGYFPSRPKIDGVTVPLYAEGSPLYALRSLGAGKVGSIMIDLEGVWSAKLFENATGRTLVTNIVNSLLRQVTTEEKHDIDVSLSENNLSTQVNVYGFGKGEEAKLVAFVLPPGGGGEPQKFDLGSLSGGGNRFVFKNPSIGVYTVQLLKVKSGLDFMDGAIRSVADIPADAVLDYVELYRAFSYSEEYDSTADPYAAGQELLAALSTREAKDGLSYSKFVYDAQTFFEPSGFACRVADPRQGLLIAAIALYFTGIVVRRFKFGGKMR